MERQQGKETRTTRQKHFVFCFAANSLVHILLFHCTFVFGPVGIPQQQISAQILLVFFNVLNWQVIFCGIYCLIIMHFVCLLMYSNSNEAVVVHLPIGIFYNYSENIMLLLFCPQYIHQVQPKVMLKKPKSSQCFIYVLIYL